MFNCDFVCLFLEIISGVIERISKAKQNQKMDGDNHYSNISNILRQRHQPEAK